MTLPTSGQLSIEDLKKELRIDLPTGAGPTDFDLSENLQLLLARTKPGAANKNFPLTLPDDFWGTRRPNDPIDFAGQIAGGVFTRNFTATRADQGATTLRFKVWRDGASLKGQITDKGTPKTPFNIIPTITTSFASITDDHEIQFKIDLLSGDPSVAPVYGVFKVADATGSEIEVSYPGPYIGSKLISFRLTVMQGDLPANTFSAVMSLLAENTFVPETTYAPGADINKGMWANVQSESDAYTHAIYSFVRRTGAQGDGYYLWRNANGQNGFDEYHFLGPWKDYDTLQFNIGVNAFNQTGGLGTGVPVGSYAFRNGAVNWQWQDITTTEKGIHSIGNRRLNSLNIVAQVRQKNTGRVYQVVTINVASEVTITSWSMPQMNYPREIHCHSGGNITVQSALQIYRDPSSGQIMYHPWSNGGELVSAQWTQAAGPAGRVPLTSRAIPADRIRLNWDTGNSGVTTNMGQPTGNALMNGQHVGIYGVAKGSNGNSGQTIWFSFTDLWTNADIWGSPGATVMSSNRYYNPPPPDTPFNYGEMGRFSELQIRGFGSGSQSAQARAWYQFQIVNGQLTFLQSASYGYGYVLGSFFANMSTGNHFVISNSRNFSARITATPRNGNYNTWRGISSFRHSAMGGNAHVSDSGWVNFAATGGVDNIALFGAGASVSAEARQYDDINTVITIQIIDNATGKLIFNQARGIQVYAQGGQSNDR